MRIAIALSGALIVTLLVACNQSDQSDSRPQAGGRAADDRGSRAVASRRHTARCRSAIISRVDPKWRSSSAVIGDVGLYGAGWIFDDLVRGGPGLDLRTKAPVVIEGGTEAVLLIAPKDRERASLAYAQRVTRTVEDGYERVRFVPCRDRPRTSWPGLLLLTDRKPVSVRVRIAGSTRVFEVRVGGPLPHPVRRVD